MNSVLLMLVLSIIRAHCVPSVPSCPASCVVCSDDVIICNRLAHIIDAPDSTQALLLTEGSISTVQPASLSDLSNITVLGLSHNHISVLAETSFRVLPLLHTLQLDHNLLTSQALQGGALTKLTQLQVLALGHNLISVIHGSWLKGNTALRSLKLEGNQLTSLGSGSFPLNDLEYLESLDLSDNLINYLDKNSFSGLENLQTVDLSRNRLGSAPAEAFSYLNWLTDLNLDLNSWNCSCQMLELAAFLSTFMQHPDKILYNGRRMVCVSADNPAVTTVLELTEANCVPSNQNITVLIESRGGVTPQLYARDLAITAVVCFIGGVGLTLLAILIYYQVSLRKKQKEAGRQKVEEEGSRTNHHVSHQDVSGQTRDLVSQSVDREVMTSDAGADGYGRQFRSRTDENYSHFCCPDCRRIESNPVKWNNKINAGMEAEEEIERRTMRMMMAEEDRRSSGTQQGILSREYPFKPLPHVHTNSSHPRKERFGQRPETLAAYIEFGDGYRTDMNGKQRKGGEKESLHCESCHRTFKPAEEGIRRGRIHNIRDSALFNGFPSQYRQFDRSMTVNHNQFDVMKNREARRETRNVTFDLERSRSHEQEEERTYREKDRGNGRKHKAKAQSSRSLKVKLNLDPLKKSKVHPKRKAERGPSQKSTPKKSKEEKGRGEREGKVKKSSKKSKKSSEVEGLTEDVDADRTESGQKNQRSPKRRRGEQESTDDRAEHKVPESSEPGENSKTVEQSASAVVIGQGQPLQSASFHGLVLGSGQLSSHPHVSRLAADSISKLSLPGSAGPQLPGQSLSLQGGSLLLNAVASGSNAMFPSNLANSIAPSIAISGASIPPCGALSSSGRQTGSGLMTPVSSLITSALQASSIPASPLHSSEAAGLVSRLQENPAVNPVPVQSLSQNQLPPDSSPLIERGQADPVQGSGSQSSIAVQHSEYQEPQTQESLTPPPQEPPTVDVYSGVDPQAQAPATRADNLSNNHSQTESGSIPAESTVHMSGGDVELTDGAGESKADVSVSGISRPSVSTQNVTPLGDVVAATALLQQEYLSEEGGSPPRRKLRLVLPEKTSSRPPTALERKIR